MRVVAVEMYPVTFFPSYITSQKYRFGEGAHALGHSERFHGMQRLIHQAFATSLICKFHFLNVIGIVVGAVFAFDRRCSNDIGGILNHVWVIRCAFLFHQPAFYLLAIV